MQYISKVYSLWSLLWIFHSRIFERHPLKVRQSPKQIMASSILPKNERWDNFQYIKLSQRSFFGRIEDTINCFRDLLTFRHPRNGFWKSFGEKYFLWLPGLGPCKSVTFSQYMNFNSSTFVWEIFYSSVKKKDGRAALFFMAY